MKTVTRTYYVNDGTKEHLIKTTIPARAVSFVAEKTFVVRVATQDDLERLLPDVKVERIPERGAAKQDPPAAKEPSGDLAKVVEAQVGQPMRIQFAAPAEPVTA